MNESFKWVAVEDYMQHQKHRCQTYNTYHYGEFNIDKLANIFQDRITSAAENPSTQPCSVKIFECNTFASVVKIISNYKLTSFGIIHDYGLSEIFNSLNLFYLHVASENDYIKYIHKLLADYFYNNDLLEDSLRVVKRYSEFHYTISNNLTDEDKVTARSYTAVQLLFIILHEFAHMLTKRHMLSDYEQESKYNIKQILSRYCKSYKEHVGQSSAYELFVASCNNEHFMDECFCDYYALEFLLTLYRKIDDPIHIIEAIFLALSHQKYIGLLKSKATITNNQGTMKTSLREACARVLLPILLYKKQNILNWTDELLFHKVDKAEEYVNSTPMLAISQRLDDIAFYYADKLPLQRVNDTLDTITETCSYISNRHWNNETKLIYQKILEELI